MDDEQEHRIIAGMIYDDDDDDDDDHHGDDAEEYEELAQHLARTNTDNDDEENDGSVGISVEHHQHHHQEDGEDGKYGNSKDVHHGGKGEVAVEEGDAEGGFGFVVATSASPSTATAATNSSAGGVVSSSMSTPEDVRDDEDDEAETTTTSQQVDVVVATPHAHDVLCVTGMYGAYKYRTHAGNEYYQDVIRKHARPHPVDEMGDSLQAIKAHRRRMIRECLDDIQSRTPPGRFLKLNAITGKWNGMNPSDVALKTIKALEKHVRRIKQKKQRNQNEQNQNEKQNKTGDRIAITNTCNNENETSDSNINGNSDKRRRIDDNHEDRVEEGTTTKATSAENAAAISSDAEIIRNPHPHDVLCGMGVKFRNRDGNQYLNKMARKYVPYYNDVAPEGHKISRSSELVAYEIERRNPPGRFLRELDPPGSGLWIEMTTKEALCRAGKAVQRRVRQQQQHYEGKTTITTSSKSQIIFGDDSEINGNNENTNMNENNSGNNSTDGGGHTTINSNSNSDQNKPATPRVLPAISSGITIATIGVFGAKSRNAAVIQEPHPHDVLCTEGSRNASKYNSRDGNAFFSSIVLKYVPFYNAAPDGAKTPRVSEAVLYEIRCRVPPGRFLKEADFVGSGNWIEMDASEALKKVGKSISRRAMRIKANAKQQQQQQLNGTENNSSVLVSCDADINNNAKVAVTVPTSKIAAAIVTPDDYDARRQQTTTNSNKRKRKRKQTKKRASSEGVVNDDATTDAARTRTLIEVPHPHDVLCVDGTYRGSRYRQREGNVFFQEAVKKHARLPFGGETTKTVRKSMVDMIRSEVESRDPPGRFLKQCSATSKWYEMDHKDIFVKAVKAAEKQVRRLRGQEHQAASATTSQSNSIPLRTMTLTEQTNLQQAMNAAPAAPTATNAIVL